MLDPLCRAAARLGVFLSGERQQGTITWRDPDDEVIGSLHYEVRADEATACMYLSQDDYRWTAGALLLATTELPWGRRRWWFRCGKGGAGE